MLSNSLGKPVLFPNLALAFRISEVAEPTRPVGDTGHQVSQLPLQLLKDEGLVV